MMLNVFDCIKFGIFPSENGVPEPIEWLVLQTNENKVKLMSKDALVNYKLFYTEDNDAPWKDSQIRRKINTEIYDTIFSDVEKTCILESITVDDEKVIKSFYWDGKDREDYVGVIKDEPVMTRDLVTIPCLRDLFDYEIIPMGYDPSSKWEWRQIKIKNDGLKLEAKQIDYAGWRYLIAFPLLNSIYNGFKWRENKVGEYKRHMVVDCHGFESHDQKYMKLRLCIWIDSEKYFSLA